MPSKHLPARATFPPLHPSLFLSSTHGISTLPLAPLNPQHLAQSVTSQCVTRQMIHEALHSSTLSSSKAFSRLCSVPRLWEKIPVKPGEEAGAGSQGERDGSAGQADEEETERDSQGDEDLVVR